MTGSPVKNTTKALLVIYHAAHTRKMPVAGHEHVVHAALIAKAQEVNVFSERFGSVQGSRRRRSVEGPAQ